LDGGKRQAALDKVIEYLVKSFPKMEAPLENDATLRDTATKLRNLVEKSSEKEKEKEKEPEVTPALAKPAAKAVKRVEKKVEESPRAIGIFFGILVCFVAVMYYLAKGPRSS